MGIRLQKRIIRRNSLLSVSCSLVLWDGTVVATRQLGVMVGALNVEPTMFLAWLRVFRLEL